MYCPLVMAEMTCHSETQVSIPLPQWSKTGAMNKFLSFQQKEQRD